MASTLDNQRLYLENMAKGNDGNAQWAKQQLKQANYGLTQNQIIPQANVPAPAKPSNTSSGNGMSTLTYNPSSGSGVTTLPYSPSSGGGMSNVQNYSSGSSMSNNGYTSGYGAGTGQVAVDNDTRLRNDEAFRNSERERTDSVINYRKSQGLDTSVQEAYRAKIMGSGGNTGSTGSSGNSTPTYGLVNGVDYGKNPSTWTPQVETDNDARLKSDPNYLKSEITRATSVLNNRKAAGLDSSSQENYLAKLMSLQGSSPSLPRANIPAPNGATSGSPYAMSPDDIDRIAKAQINQKRADITGAVNSYNRQLKNNFDLQSLVNADNRALEDARWREQNASTSFSGGSAYQRAMLDRTRGLQDMSSNADYQARLAESNQKIRDFELLAPDEQFKIVNELKTKEREMGLKEGELTGYLYGKRTLAGSKQDADMTGYYKGTRTLAGQKLDQDKMLQMAELTGYLPNGQKTSKQQQVELENLWTASEQAGVIHPTLAKMYGIPEGTQTLKAKQMVEDVRQFNEKMTQTKIEADRDYRINQGQLAVSQQNANTAQRNAANSGSSSGSGSSGSSGKNSSEWNVTFKNWVDQIDNAFVKNKSTNSTDIKTNQTTSISSKDVDYPGITKFVYENLELSDREKDQILAYYNLPSMNEIRDEMSKKQMGIDQFRQYLQTGGLWNNLKPGSNSANFMK